MAAQYIVKWLGICSTTRTRWLRRRSSGVVKSINQGRAAGGEMILPQNFCAAKLSLQLQPAQHTRHTHHGTFQSSPQGW